MAILGISTNTRLLGFAVINQGDWVDYSIRLHKSSWSPPKADMILASLEPCVRQYSITKVIVSIPYEYHQTEAFKTLLSHIREFFEAKNIAVIAKTPEAFAISAGTKKKKESAHEFPLPAIPSSYSLFTERVK